MSTAGGVEHRLGPLAQIPPGEGREFIVAGRRIAVFRPRGGGVAATQAECPHRAGPLADGIVGMDTIMCPLHNWRFRLVDGVVEVGDCGIAVHAARVDDEGELMVALAAG